MAAWTETISSDDILQLEPVVQPHQVRYQVRGLRLALTPYPNPRQNVVSDAIHIYGDEH